MRSTFVVRAGLLVALVGCGSSSSSSPPANGDGGTDGAVSGTAFEVWVAEAPPGMRTDTYPPIVNATVAWDPPGGGARVVAQTDAQGHVTVYGDFTKGDGVLTVWEKDHTAFTQLQASPAVSMSLAGLLPNPMGKPATDAVFLLQRKLGAKPSPVAKLMGNISNKADPADVVALYPPGLGAGIDAPGANYSITVPTGRPYSIVGFEYKPDATQPDRGTSATTVKFFKIDRPAQSADTTLDLDMSQIAAESTTKGSATITVPGGDSGPLGGTTRSFFYTADLDGNAFYGVWPKAVLSADKSAFDISFEYVAPPADARVVTRGLIINPGDGSASLVQKAGAPTDGMTLDGFPLPMPVTVTKVAYTDPIAFDGLPSEATTAQIQILQGNEVPWTIGNPKKVSPITLPKLPDDVLAAFKGNRTARFIYFTGDSIAPQKSTDLAAPTHAAFSRTFTLTVQ